MEFNNFALSSTKIKSNWLDGGKKSVFNQIGKEEGLNLYIQLFRFRQHQIIGDNRENYNHHIFRVTVGELIQFTRINLKRKLTSKQVVDLLRKMENVGVIKLHKPYRWNKLFDDNGKVISDKLIVLQATDIPNLYVEKNNKGREIEKPVNENEDYYISINFRTLEHMYNELSLTSKDVTVYLLLLKLSNGGEDKATININTMKEWLGYGNDTITTILQSLNSNNMVATYSKRSKKGISYEHVPVRSYSNINEFIRVHEEAIRIFMNRYKKKKENPFENVDENAINGNDWVNETNESEWGVSPSGY